MEGCNRGEMGWMFSAQKGEIMKRIIVLLFCLISLPVFAADQEIIITLLNGTKSIISVDDTVDEIYGVKMYLSFKKEGKIVKEYRHISPITNIENIQKLNNVKKLSLFMELHNISDMSMLQLANIEELYISYGLMIRSLDFLQKMPKLKVLYLSNIQINPIDNMNLENLKLDYFELSSSGSITIRNTKFPASLRYLNLWRNESIYLDEETQKNINTHGIQVISDNGVKGIKNQIIGNDFYNKVDPKYTQIGP
jgi:hypothetical protein